MTFTSPVITDADIEKTETLFPGIVFDAERLLVLKSSESAEIQAFPGTGKTTLLVAKLAILVPKWNLKNQGICVLSHTNVAKREIEKRLGKSCGARLLNYPHYVGTIDSFINTFISKPYLNNIGIKQHTIDTKIVTERRKNQLSSGAKSYLKIKYKDFSRVLQLKAWRKEYKIQCGENTQSYKDISKTIDESVNNGDLTFEEVRLIADYCLKTYTDLSEILSNRFPLVFIDEAQDTTETVWKILRQSFKNSVIQTFGDDNQAIFDGANSSNGSNERNLSTSQSKLVISNSKRFGESIARLADPLGLEKGLRGSNLTFEHLDNKHTIFLFDKEKPGSVIKAFGQHILDNFSDDDLNNYSDLGCHILGQVHKPDKDKKEKQQPKNLQFYFPEYQPDPLQTYVKHDDFFSFLGLGKNTFLSTNNSFDFCQALCQAVEYQLKKNKISTTFHASALRRVSSSLSKEQEFSFRHDLLRLQRLCEKEINNKEWIQLFENILEKYWGIKTIEETFFNNPNIGIENLKKKNNANNTFIYQDATTGRSVNLQFGSIHSAKGETHLCTLVVETYNRAHNLKKIIPFLTGAKSAFDNETEALRLKTHYVALTRARALVCLAMPKAHIKQKDLDLLSNVGWQIKII